MHNARSVLALAVSVALVVMCCTYNEPRLRTEPIASAVGKQALFQGNEMTVDNMKFRCTEWHSPLNKLNQRVLELFTGWHSAMDECVYLTVDPQTALHGDVFDAESVPKAADQIKIERTTPETEREYEIAGARMIAARTNDLLAISDYNCGNFLAGAFAAKTDTDFGSSLTSTILSGTTSVLSLASGVNSLVPAAISAGNSTITGATAAFDSNFFAKQTFDILETGILAHRQTLRAEIAARICESFRPRPDHDNGGWETGRVAQPTPTPAPAADRCIIAASGDYPGYTPKRYYTMAQALGDVIEYDRSCSIEGGLKELSGQAAKLQQKADAAVGSGAPTPTATPQATPTATRTTRKVKNTPAPNHTPVP